MKKSPQTFKCECNSVHEMDENPKRACYVNSPKHYNCYFVWEYYWDGEAMGLEEVGALLNVSYERIRQIEVIALEKLRNEPKADILRKMMNDTEEP